MGDGKLLQAKRALCFILLGTVPSQCQTATPQYRVGVGPPDSPLVLNAPDAPYTTAAAKANIKGTVLVSATVGTDGCAHDLKLGKTPGYGLAQSALEAVAKWKFRKLQKATHVNIEVNFDPKWSSEGSLKSIPPCTDQK